MVQKSQGQPTVWMVLKPCKEWDFNYRSLNWFKIAGFLNHQILPPPPGKLPLFEDDGFSGQKRPLNVGGRFFPSFPEVAQPVEAVSQIKWGSQPVGGRVAGSLCKKEVLIFMFFFQNCLS